jgi:hypothetical protein
VGARRGRGQLRRPGRGGPRGRGVRAVAIPAQHSVPAADKEPRTPGRC